VWSASTSYPFGYKVVENGEIYHTGDKVLYTIPGEPSGSPAIGVTASPSPSSAVPTTSPSATGSTGATG
jgi:hypothetical protein